MTRPTPRILLVLLTLASGCDAAMPEPSDAGSSPSDSGPLALDAGAAEDAGRDGGGPPGMLDAGPSSSDAGPSDAGPPPAGACGVGPQADFACTMVIGFSQTSNWYGSMAAPAFEAAPGVDPDRWQLLWHGGAGVESWADPAYEGWDPSARMTQLVSPCAADFDGVDRVVLTLSSNLYTEDSPAEDWAAEIRAAVATVRSMVPGVREIALQPVVASDGLACGTRAEANRPRIDEAIALVVGGDVVAGAFPYVAACSDFADDKGHLAVPARSEIANRIAECYGR